MEPFTPSVKTFLVLAVALAGASLGMALPDFRRHHLRLGSRWPAMRSSLLPSRTG
jgi:hypothetical protein